MSIASTIAELKRRSERVRERTEPQTQWERYETLKVNWLRAHPQATAEEITAANRRIAEELGL